MAVDIISQVDHLPIGPDEKGLTYSQVRRCRITRETAVWYYYGREDALEHTVPANDPRRRDAWGFGLYATALRRKFERGDSYWMPSIQDIYRTYIKERE